MNAQNPLANLRDIHLPEAVGWWPLAPGWWLLIALFFLGLIWLFYKLYQRHKFRQTYRECLTEISVIDSTYQTSKDAHRLVSDYSQLLRRLLMLRLGRQQTASQTGEDLVHTLEQHNLLHESFSDSHKQALIDGPYRKSIDIDDYQQFKHSLDKVLLNLSLLTTRGKSHA